VGREQPSRFLLPTPRSTPGVSALPQTWFVKEKAPYHLNGIRDFFGCYMQKTLLSYQQQITNIKVIIVY